MANASITMIDSKYKLWMMLTPNNGRVDMNMGSRAQWMAQASEEVIPNASQLILSFMKRAKLGKKQHCCKILIG